MFMFLYTAIEAVVGVVAGILLAACSKKTDHEYGKLDKAGKITNIVLIPVYLCLAPFNLVYGTVSAPAHEGFWGVIGWIITIITASAVLVCGLGLGFSVVLRKKGKSKLSFAVQFAGILASGLTFFLYCVFAGNLLKYIK